MAIRGLLIASGRLREAADVLLAWSGHVSAGHAHLIDSPMRARRPNTNAVDASLWFVVVVHELLATGGAGSRQAARLREAVVAVLEGYASGTRYGIALDEHDGLLRAGEPGVQLTWMDARIGEHVVTPAHRQASRGAGALDQRPQSGRRLAGRCTLAHAC